MSRDVSGARKSHDLAASSAASVLESIGRLQDATAGTPYEPLVDALVDALADDTTAVDLRQELAFRDAEIDQLRERLRPIRPMEGDAVIDLLWAARQSLIDHAVQLPLKRRDHGPVLIRIDAMIERLATDAAS